MLHSSDLANAGGRAAARISVAHIVASLDPVHGGPSYAVPRLCRALAEEGAGVALLSVASPSEAPPACADGVALFPLDLPRVPILRDLRWSSALVRDLRRRAPGLGVVHSHGLWLMPNVQSAAAARAAGVPFIVSPRGMLGAAALAFSRGKKRLFWHLAQGAAVRAAACLHATSEQEYREIRAFGLANPVAVVPNGIDVPEAEPRRSASDGRRVVLSLGRLHPKKGLDRLVRAWALVEAAHPAWHLRLVGPDAGGYGTRLAALSRELGLARISIEPPLSGAAKLAAYRGADLFVLPTLNENFASTVAEALAAGTPVLASKGAPWPGLVTEGCGWWVEPEVGALAGALTQAMAVPAGHLAAMGARGRDWMIRDFSWRRVAQDMLAVYRWLIAGGAPPAAVRLR